MSAVCLCLFLSPSLSVIFIVVFPNRQTSAFRRRLRPKSWKVFHFLALGPLNRALDLVMFLALIKYISSYFLSVFSKDYLRSVLMSCNIYNQIISFLLIKYEFMTIIFVLFRFYHIKLGPNTIFSRKSDIAHVLVGSRSTTGLTPSPARGRDAFVTLKNYDCNIRQ